MVPAMISLPPILLNRNESSSSTVFLSSSSSSRLVDTVLQNGQWVNESCLNLSPFQWMLLIMTVVHTCTFHVLDHSPIFLHQLPNWSARHYYRFALGVNVLRFIICLGMEWRETMKEGHSYDLGTSLFSNFVQHYKDALKPFVVVTLLQVQTHFVIRSFDLNAFVASLSLEGTIVGVALISIVVFQYRYTQSQWVALGTIVLGSMLAHPFKSQILERDNGITFLGLIRVLSAVIAGSLAMFYWEFVLKHDLAGQRADPPSASLWIRGMQFSLALGLMDAIHVFRTRGEDDMSSFWPDDDNDMESYSRREYRARVEFLLAWKGFFVPALVVGPLLTMGTLKYITAVHDRVAIAVATSLALILNYQWFGEEYTSTGTLYSSFLMVIGSAYLFAAVPVSLCSTTGSRRPPRPNNNNNSNAHHRNQLGWSTTPPTTSLTASSSYQPVATNETPPPVLEQGVSLAPPTHDSKNSTDGEEKRLTNPNLEVVDKDDVELAAAPALPALIDEKGGALSQRETTATATSTTTTCTTERRE